MELFKDKKQALEELDYLLQEDLDEPEEDLDEEPFDEEYPDDELDEDLDEDEPNASAVIYHNYANDYGRRIYNTDRTDTDLEDYSDQIYAPKTGADIKRLIAIAFTLAAAILGVVIWWIIRYL